jgi:hypothetical protein
LLKEYALPWSKYEDAKLIAREKDEPFHEASATENRRSRTSLAPIAARLYLDVDAQLPRHWHLDRLQGADSRHGRERDSRDCRLHRFGCRHDHRSHRAALVLPLLGLGVETELGSVFGLATALHLASDCDPACHLLRNQKNGDC